MYGALSLVEHTHFWFEGFLPLFHVSFVSDFNLTFLLPEAFFYVKSNHTLSLSRHLLLQTALCTRRKRTIIKFLKLFKNAPN